MLEVKKLRFGEVKSLQVLKQQGCEFMSVWVQPHTLLQDHLASLLGRAHLLQYIPPKTSNIGALRPCYFLDGKK